MTSFDQDLLTSTELFALADANSRTAPTGIRNRSLVLLLAATGIRIQEALDLRPKDINIEDRTVTVQHGKGGKRRVVPIVVREALDALELWLTKRQALDINGHKKLFTTLAGGPLSQQYCRQVLPRLRDRAGIEKRVHPHGMRHYFTAWCVRHGLQPSYLQTLLGHSNLSTTTAYTKRLTGDEAVQAALRIAQDEDYDDRRQRDRKQHVRSWEEQQRRRPPRPKLTDLEDEA